MNSQPTQPTTTLSRSFLRTVVMMVAYKPEPMRRAQAALLYMALEGGTFTAADLPGEITGGSKHIAGAATGSLIALGLLVTKGRVKSPDVSAKGRKLDLLAGGETGRIRAWLRANGCAETITACAGAQGMLAL